MALWTLKLYDAIFHQHAAHGQRVRDLAAVLAGRAAGGWAGADDVAVPARPVRRQRGRPAHHHRLPVRVLDEDLVNRPTVIWLRQKSELVLFPLEMFSDFDISHRNNLFCTTPPMTMSLRGLFNVVHLNKWIELASRWTVVIVGQMKFQNF